MGPNGFKYSTEYTDDSYACTGPNQVSSQSFVDAWPTLRVAATATYDRDWKHSSAGATNAATQLRSGALK